MCIISPKRELLKQPQIQWDCEKLLFEEQKCKMVTPSKSHPNSKSGQGGVGGTKRPQHQSQHYTKRHQNHQSTSPPVPLSTSSPSQKSRPNNYRSNQTNPGNNSQPHQTRISPNPNPNNFNNSNIQRSQQRQNRQTPPRNIVTNHVNMNNGKPSLERATLNPLHSYKNGTAQNKQHSQKSSQVNHLQTQKGPTVNHISRSSPISANLSKSNRSSPQCFAGSKCFEPPTPNSLPKPPPDWTPLLNLDSKQNLLGNVRQSLTYDDMAEANGDGVLNDNNQFSVSSARDVSQELKLILNVHA